MGRGRGGGQRGRGGGAGPPLGGERPGPRRGMGVLVAAYAGYAAFWGTWVVAFPEWVRAYRMTLGAAGLAFAATAGVAIVVMTFVTPRLERLPRRRSVALSLLLHAAGDALLVSAPRSVILVAFCLLGAGAGL